MGIKIAYWLCQAVEIATASKIVKNAGGCTEAQSNSINLDWCKHVPLHVWMWLLSLCMCLLHKMTRDFSFFKLSITALLLKSYGTFLSFFWLWIILSLCLTQITLLDQGNYQKFLKKGNPVCCSFLWLFFLLLNYVTNWMVLTMI